MIGNLTQQHQEIFQKNPLFIGMRLPYIKKIEHLWPKFPQITSQAIDLIKVRWIDLLCQCIISFADSICLCCCKEIIDAIE